MSCRQLALVVLSGCGLALAFPPCDVTLASWVALVPFFWVIGELSPGRAALAGLVWGTVHTWGIGWWVPLAISGYWGQPAWFGIVFSLLASIVFVGTYAAAFAASAAWAAARVSGLRRVLLLAGLWVGWELARARVLTGDPWLLSGYALVPYATVAQTADLGGVYLLSFLLAAVNASLTELLATSRRGAGARAALRPIALGTTLLALAAGYGALRLAASDDATAGAERRVAIVQGNVDVETQWRPELREVSLARYLDLSRDVALRARPELLIWPESAVTFFLASEPALRDAIGRVLGATGVSLIVGGPHLDGTPADERYFNSAFLLDPRGRVRARYDKARLLPFAEYFPLRSIALLRRHFERVRTFTPGTGDVVLPTSIGNAGIAICFEAIFPELVREQVRHGAEILVNLSNDAWLGAGPGPAQHLRMVRLRAIESRRWLVRSTTTGVSAIVDPFGRVVASVPAEEAGVVAGSVVPLRGATPYQRVGDLFAYACAVGSALGMLALRGTPPRSARAKPRARSTGVAEDSAGSALHDE